MKEVMFKYLKGKPNFNPSVGALILKEETVEITEQFVILKCRSHSEYCNTYKFLLDYYCDKLSGDNNKLEITISRKVIFKINNLPDDYLDA